MKRTSQKEKNNMIKVGDKISAMITVESPSGQSRQRKTGNVVYVHPKGRFCRANFKVGFEAYHQETFQLVEGKPLPKEAQIIRDE